MERNIESQFYSPLGIRNQRGIETRDVPTPSEKRERKTEVL